ncbi:uncharacterized protein LOC120636691 isoform X2 [Pararge aegeria]|uniref:uncharacterized protein LOC120636691 isoform X2 n=1 Tax=Pararge aegeria TaxID=116150 RepID=UPI0019D1A33E|nr:uncharacterized protein LOC120636691 isoform X2 [Pararge aegeria]
MAKENRAPQCLVSIACISSILSMILSLINVFLSVLVFTFRFSCDLSNIQHRGDQYFVLTIIRTYIIRYTCDRSLHYDKLTKADSVYVLAVICLVFALINLATAFIMIHTVTMNVKNYDITIYAYLGTSLAMFVVDLTIGVHFGIDTQTMKIMMGSHSAGHPSNYEYDMIRLGAMLLMAIAFKGYMGHFVNLMLLLLLGTLVIRQHRKKSVGDDHSIQRFGVINAYERSLNILSEDEPQPGPAKEPSVVDISSPLRDPWVYRTDASGYPRGGQSNLVFNGEEEPSRIQVSVKESTSDGICNRSPSWLFNSGAALPFSYLEDPKRPLPVKPPTTATTEHQWRRSAWPPTPAVPDPDYSPPPRRLKSALKSNYI